MKKNILIFVLVILVLGFLSTSAVLLAYISNAQFQNTLKVNDLNSQILKLESDLAIALDDKGQNGIAVGEPNPSTPETSVETKTRKTYVIEALDNFIPSSSFTALTYKDALGTQIKNTNGLPFTGINITDSKSLDITLRLPYEAFNYAFSERILIDKDTALGDIYRVKSEEGTVFYTNKFFEGDGYMSCSDKPGTKICASPVLSNQKDGVQEKSFQIICNNTSESGLKACDSFVESLEF